MLRREIDSMTFLLDTLVQSTPWCLVWLRPGPQLTLSLCVALYSDKIGIDAEQNQLIKIKGTEFGSGPMRVTVIRGTPEDERPFSRRIGSHPGREP